MHSSHFARKCTPALFVDILSRFVSSRDSHTPRRRLPASVSCDERSKRNPSTPSAENPIQHTPSTLLLRLPAHRSIYHNEPPNRTFPGLKVEEVKQATLLHDKDSLLGVLLGTWGTGAKASSAWSHDTPEEQLPSAAAAAADNNEMAEMVADKPPLSDGSFVPLPSDARDSQERLFAEPQSTTLQPQGEAPEMDVRRSADLGPDNGTGGKNKSMSRQSCEELVEEARARLRLAGQQTVPGALAAAGLAQINDVMATAAVERPSRLDDSESFRALIFGGVGSRIAPGETGLEHEELLQVVSLLLQLSSLPTRSEVTYANPDRSVLEAARSVASSCVNEFGIVSGGRVRLDFVRSSLDDFLSTPINQHFDFVDLGGPLSWSGGARNGNGGDNIATIADASAAPVDAALLPGSVLHADTLRLLGPKLAPGACLKAWAFARNPSTSSAFHAAARHKRRQAATASTTGWAAEEQGSGGTAAFDMLRSVLRTRFGIGGVAPTSQHLPKTRSESTTPTAGAGEEEMWVRQVLAGGDRLSIPDINEVLAGGGFELVVMLGKNDAEQEVEDEFLGGDLARWKTAELAGSLEFVPNLVYQVLAVWRGGGSGVALPQ